MRIYYGAFLEPSPVDFTCTIHVILGKFYFSVIMCMRREHFIFQIVSSSRFSFSLMRLITLFSYLCIQIL